VKLSAAAVSMALRNHPSLPAATIERVRRAAEAMNYAPNPAATALASHRTTQRAQRDFSVIALVSNWSRRDGWLRMESGQQLFAGATARSRVYGYEVQHFWAKEGAMSPRRFSRILAARGIRGLILAPLEDPDSRLDLDWDGFTVVTIERFLHYPQFHHVVPNYFADLQLAWEKLRERGYARIGLVVERSLADRVGHQWEAAYAFAQSGSGFRRRAVPVLVVTGKSPRAEIGAWLAEHRPDAVISRCHDVWPTLKALRLRVPGDMGYASLNIVDDAPHVSGILQHRDVMGATAIDVIQSLLHRNHRGPNRVSQGTHVDGTWFEGRTVRAPA